MSLQLSLQALKFSASTKLLPSHAAVIQNQGKFAAAGSDGRNSTSAVRIIAICHLIGLGLNGILALVELRHDHSLPHLDLKPPIFRLRYQNSIGSLLDHLVSNL